MGVTKFDWASNHSHRDYMLNEFGFCVTVLDNNFTPVGDITRFVEWNSITLHNGVGELDFKLDVGGRPGFPTPVVDALISEGLTGLDDGHGHFRKTRGVRGIMLETRDRATGTDSRFVYFVVATGAVGSNGAVSLLHPKGLELRDVLNWLPCPSLPESWSGDWHMLDQDWAAKFSRPREACEVHFSTQPRASRGPVVDVLTTVLGDSVRAFHRVAKEQRWPIVVAAATGDKGPEVTVICDDRSLAEVVTPVCSLTGARVNADLFLPGEQRPPLVEGCVSSDDYPQIVLTVEHTGGGVKP